MPTIIPKCTDETATVVRAVRRRLVRRPAPPRPAAPTETPADDARPLLRLAAVCPRCGSRPALRVTEELVRALKEAPGETRLGTYQCQRRGCGTIYDLVAEAYHRSE